MAGLPTKIDVHAHFLPPAYRTACIENGHANPDGMPYLPEWDEQTHIQLMDKLNIKKSILSVSTPGTHLVPGDAQLAAKVARECNSYAADLKRRIPDRFGYWASLPIPDVDLCLRELQLSADEGCDGYVFMTNGHGRYLGDSAFDPIFDELNRRKATIFIHPTTPCIACDWPAARDIGANTDGKPTKATPFAGQFPNPMIEFLFDTVRAVTNLFFSGTIQRCPDLKIILPHLGGTFPPLLSRISLYSQMVPGPYISTPEPEVRESFHKQFWWDLAGVPVPGQIRALLAGLNISADRILYGSDFPFAKAPVVETLNASVDEEMPKLFDAETIENIYNRNATKLLDTGT